MTKIPSVEERVADFKSKFVYHVVLGSTLNGGTKMRFNLTPELAIAWLRETLTAERTALLTELRDWEAEKDCHYCSPDSGGCGGHCTRVTPPTK